MSGKAITEAQPVTLRAPSTAQPKSWRQILLAPKLAGWATVLILIAAWEAGVRLGHVSPLYLPGPIETAAALYDLFATGHLLTDMSVSLMRIFGGFLVAAVTGVALGIWMGASPRVQAICDILIAALYPLPKVTLIPLLVIWLGQGELFQLTISWLGAVFPIVINTVLGVRHCDSGLILALRDLNATPRQIQWKVVLPSSIPHILAGLKLGLGVSIILVVAGEMVAGKIGLGARLYLSGQIMQTEQVFAVLVLLAIIGIIITKGGDLLDRLGSRWHTD
jgi:ABC-type nitrate/sulfonate/bicarbonate transport system permease component